MLLMEKATRLADKAKAEATLDELTQKFTLGKEALQKALSDLEQSLESAKANQAKAEETSKKKYSKSFEWQHHTSKCGEFITNVLLKLGDTFTGE